MLHRSNKTAGAKRGLIETSAYDALLPYVADPDEPPRYALHFGTVDKVGVNPRSEHDTPLAVCAYPLTEEIFEQFLSITLPFAQKEAKYLYLLEIRPEARVFYSTPQFFKQGVGPEYVSTARKSEKFFYSTRPKDYEDRPMYFSAEHETVARAAQWGLKLSKMRIDVWVDADNEGILHDNEPSQVMFFNPRSYSIVFSMDNPKNSFVARYGRDWRKRKDVRVMDLTYADLTGISLRGVNLTGAKLTGADLTYADLTGAHLTRANLIGATLTGATLTGATLTGAKLTGAFLDRAYLRDVKYDDSTVWPDSVRDVLRVWRGDKNLIEANLREAKLNDADLTRADLTRADLTNANLIKANLTRATLTRATLTHANLIKANLTNATLTGAKLFKADLIEANLNYADLTRANLNDADLTGAILTDAKLRGADLRYANLTGANLEGIEHDEDTSWPDGFTPPPSTPRPKRHR
jgi:uncharacterized protein YjbI with pentapeptide repeats